MEIKRVNLNTCHSIFCLFVSLQNVKLKMAHNLSKFIALLINCCGVFLFRTPTTCSVHPNSSAVPSLIFALTVYTFVIDISYFKSAYRKLYLPCQFVLEVSGDFVIVTFLTNMSFICFSFWPLCLL